MFGPKTEEVAGDCSKLHNEKLHDLHSLPDFYMGDIHGKGRNTYKFLVGEPEGERQVVGSKHRWEDTFKMGV